MMMKLLLVAALLVCADVASGAELTIAAEGRCDYQVVLPDEAPAPPVAEGLRKAATLVVDALAANGYKVGTVAEKDADADKPGIYLGDTRFARAHGVRTEKFPDWRYVHKVVGRDIIIAGRDEPARGEADTPIGKRRLVPRLATIKAVADFLRAHAGARFLFPGKSGIEFLPTPTIAVPADLDVMFVPRMEYNRSVNQGDAVYEIANNLFPSVGLYFRAHSHPQAVPSDKYREEHPEYFALIKGERCCNKRNWKGDWAGQLCLSNPEVQELIYQHMVRWLGRGYSMVPLGQADAFKPCECKDCHALFDTGDDWGEKIWILHRNLAARLHKEHPKARILALAYQRTTLPPKTFTEFPPNVTVQLCTNTPETLAAWRRCTMPGGLAGYIRNWGSSHRVSGFTPKRTPRYVEEQVKRLCANGVRGIHRDGAGELYGLEAPVYYVFGRMFDDPEKNTAAALLDEFYSAAFGRAARHMSLFYRSLHESIAVYSDFLGPRGAAIAYENTEGKRRYYVHDSLRLIGYLHAPDTLKRMEKLLAFAERLARLEGRQKVLLRLALVRTEFDYLKDLATIAHLDEAHRARPDRASLVRLLDAVDARNAWLDALYDKRGRMKPIPGWPEMKPFAGRPRAQVALVGSKNKSWFGHTPLNWDTAAKRKTMSPDEEPAVAPAP
jgi:Domain of unknown function (DUF4838)